jgi:hypothetical protein
MFFAEKIRNAGLFAESFLGLNREILSNNEIAQ